MVTEANCRRRAVWTTAARSGCRVGSPPEENQIGRLPEIGKHPEPAFDGVQRQCFRAVLVGIDVAVAALQVAAVGAFDIELHRQRAGAFGSRHGAGAPRTMVVQMLPVRSGFSDLVT